jgi:UDP-N-acetylglucosamine 4,6-dehydratase/5-epimerase
MKRILVTGACGSIGKALVLKLLEGGNKVCAFDNNEDGLFHLMKEHYSFALNLKIFVGDVRDIERLEQAMDGVEEVYHCAALKHVELSEYNPFEALKTNVNGTNNVINAAIKKSVKKVLVTSSDKAVNPSSTMGTTKLLAEKLTISANNYSGSKDIKFGCVRFGNVWNTNGSVGPIFKNQILSGEDITVTDKGMTRFFTSKDDAINLCIDACSSLIGGEIFISDMGATSIGLIADEFQSYNPDVNVIEIGPKPGEKLFEELFTDVESARTFRYSDMYVILPDCLDKESTKYNQLQSFYNDSNPIGTALISDSEIAKKVDAKKLVSGLMNES